MPGWAHAQLDFGYPWWLSYGHLVILAISLSVMLVAFARKWPRWTAILFGLLTLWSSSAFLIVRFGFDANSVPSLPTERFLSARTGRVLDMGAGTGRSSIMLLQSRPEATLVALDLFAESFDVHFGKEAGSPQQRLLANLKAAGVEGRATIATGDMRQLPFEGSAFDAIVSSYAIDHLSRDGATKALSEAARVIKPRGEFLLMVVTKEPWLQYAFGPLLAHGGARSTDWWISQLRTAGFEIMEQGTRVGTFYVRCRRG